VFSVCDDTQSTCLSRERQVERQRGSGIERERGRERERERGLLQYVDKEGAHRKPSDKRKKRQ
jgi:hypothetical protein